MMLKCIVIDDEPHAVAEILEHLDRVPNVEVIGSATDPVEGLRLILEKKPDVVFLDIEMDDLNGFELKKLIPKDVKVVFCTAYSEFAIKGFEVDAVDYLVKPLLFERILAAVLRVEDRVAGNVAAFRNPVPLEDDYFYFNEDYRGKRIQVYLKDIWYVEANDEFVNIYLEDRTYVSAITMKDMEYRLGSEHFSRIHKSFIIPLRYVERVEFGMVKIRGKADAIPLGRVYKENFMVKIDLRLLSKNS